MRAPAGSLGAADSSRFVERAAAAAAVAFLVAIPFVSAPWFPSGLRTIVSPAVLYPLAILLPLAFLRACSAGTWDRGNAVRAGFVATLILTGSLPLVTELLSVDGLGVGPARRYLRTVLSIAIAVASYLGAQLIARHLLGGGRVVVATLRIAARAFAVVGLLGAAAMVRLPGLTELYVLLREATTTNGANVIGGMHRLVSLTFEPSFAGLEYTAWWLALALALALVHGRGWWLVGAYVLFTLFTKSITGLLGLTGLALALALLGRTQRRLRLAAALVAIGALVGLSVLPLLSQTRSVPVVTRLTQEVGRLFDGSLARNGPSDGSLAVRAALAHTALNVWRVAPVLGTGLGLSGYRFEDHPPEWADRSVYLAEYWGYVLTPEGRVYPSAKNLYLRLLSDTGVVGLLLFFAVAATAVAPILRAWRCLHRLPTGERELHRSDATVLLASLLGAGAALAGYTSVDSFAFPFLWTWWGLGVGTADRLRERGVLRG